MRKIKRALISVSNKQNLKKLLSTLKKYNVEIISSGGTFKEIKKLGYKCIEVSDYTNSPEILGGRVKTLHPKIHGGILNIRSNKTHQKDIKENEFGKIDLVIVNFYPFEKIIQSSNNHDKIIENIDIGGPTLVRSAAKNFKYVTVITNPDQYSELIKQMRFLNGSTSFEFRKKLSSEAFSDTSYYDSLISNYFNKINGIEFPKKKVIGSKIIDKFRYGENPHQQGALYSNSDNFKLKQLSGKQLSYNNYNDIFAALEISKSLPKNTGTVIIKHTNPCGVSIVKDKLKSFSAAFKCDPKSAFGGIVSCNFIMSKKVALEIQKIFLEVIIANGYEKEALKILKKKKNLRIIDAKDYKPVETKSVVSNLDSSLHQSIDNIIFNKNNFKVVSKVKPSSTQFRDLIFAFNICRFTKSNAIVLAKELNTLGIGSGQPSRLDSCKIAVDKMNKFQSKNINDIVAASDAFFPFVDGIEKLVQAGATAIVQPYGSIRDKEIIKFANQTKVALVFSKTRHFKH
ncbi:MAG: bifunctional phosphoribosylaminoimidazolecarboxamide formyltransferase/IMP cyclohydrolase [Candidatus Pelagibacter sp.]